MQFKQGQKVRLISPKNEITYPKIRIASNNAVGVIANDVMVLFRTSDGKGLLPIYRDWRIEEIESSGFALLERLAAESENPTTIIFETNG